MPQMSPLNWMSIFMSVLLLVFCFTVWWNFTYLYLVQDKSDTMSLVVKKWMW